MDPIERNSSLSYRVAEELGRAIVGGDFVPDDALPTEAELCQKFGVSRTAVREAVKMLSAKGLISSKPRRGIRVMPAEDWNLFDFDLLKWSLEGRPSREILIEFFQLRLAVEPEAAVLAARYASPEDKGRISAALERMRETNEFSESGITADLDFHVSLLYATKNRFYIRLRDFIRTALNVAIQFTTPASKSYDDVVAAHEKVLRAIEAGDVERARMSMRTLIEDALELIEAGADSFH
jgi:DNA-binding FadR family transcriptional regulator